MRRAIICLLVLAFIAPAEASSAQRAPEIEDVPDGIERLLADYSRAWREKDASLLAATLSTDLAQRETKSLANAREVRFDTFEVEATTQFSGNLASARIRAKYRGVDVATYQVDERTRITDETDTYVEPGAFTFTRDASGGTYDGWRLASKSDLDVLGFFSPYHLWDEKPVVVLRSERFIVLTHGDVADVIRPVLKIAESAYDHDESFWPEDLTDRFVMIVPSSTDELRRIMHETVALDKFVAFVAAGAEREEGWAPTGPRVFVHLSHLRNYGPSAQLEIVAHELIHAITRRIAGPKMPAWVEEGLANLGGGTGGRASRVSRDVVPDDFPSDEKFFAGPVRGIQTVYDQAQLAIQVLDEKVGREGVVNFYTELGSRRVVPGTEEYHVRDAVKAVGWTYDEWVAAWQQRIRNG